MGNSLAIFAFSFCLSFYFRTENKKRPEICLRAKKSAVPPEFPQSGHSNAVTGLPVLPYCSFRKSAPGRHSAGFLMSLHQPDTLWQKTSAKPSHQGIYYNKLTHILVGVNRFMQKSFLIHTVFSLTKSLCFTIMKESYRFSELIL